MAEGGDASPPPYEAGIEVPELASGPLQPGAVVEVIYPGGQMRQYTHLLQRWDGQRWTTPYQVFVSDPARPPSAEYLRAHGWTDGDEDVMQPEITFGGAEGGQFTVIPPPAEAGTYRICHVSTAYCSEPFEVAEAESAITLFPMCRRSTTYLVLPPEASLRGA